MIVHVGQTILLHLLPWHRQLSDGISNQSNLKASIQDDVKLDQLVRAQDYQSRGRQFDSGKIPKMKPQIYMDLSYIDP